MNPGYLEKLTPGQQQFAKRAVGVKFVKEFIWKHGTHCYVFGNTGSGKTQKGYWLVDWLKHTENIIWISSGKSDEILPLFFLGKKVRVIIPAGADFTIEGPLDNQPEIVQVSSPREAWKAVKGPSWDKSRHKCRDTINIFEFRNTIASDARFTWMTELFDILAVGSREKTLPRTLFPCTIFIDESQWLMAGKRISQAGDRARATSMVIENVLEMRSAGCRFALFAQSYKNIPPAARENMLCALLCRGAWVSTAESETLAYQTHLRPGPEQYTPNQGKFVYPDGSAYPMRYPILGTWDFPLYPREEADRERVKECQVKYGTKFGELRLIPQEPEPDLNAGIYQDRMTKPEPVLSITRWDPALQSHSN
jgi:hypothetical protein